MTPYLNILVAIITSLIGIIYSTQALFQILGLFLKPKKFKDAKEYHHFGIIVSFLYSVDSFILHNVSNIDGLINILNCASSFFISYYHWNNHYLKVKFKNKITIYK